MTSLARSLYATALLAFPRRFRARHAADMRFAAGARLQSRRGWSRLIEFVALLGDAIWAGFAQRLAERRESRRRLLPATLHGGSSPHDLPVREWTTFMTNVLTDLRYAFRGLVLNPTYSIVALVTLALGIGATTAIFSVVDTVLLRPLPYPNSEELVVLYETHPQRGDALPTSVPTYLELRDTLRGADLAAYEWWGLTYTGGDEPVDVTTIRASPNLFEVLGVSPSAGRAFADDESDPGKGNVVVLGHEFWQERLGGVADVLGSTIDLDHEPYTVVGVAPPGFTFPPYVSGFVPELYVPRELDAASAAAAGGRDSRNLWTIARLQGGTELPAARDEAAGAMANIVAALPDRMENYSATLESAHDQLVVSNTRQPLLVMLGAVTLLLLIACANVANLLIARLSGRTREVALRAAIGAGRHHLFRQFLTESLVLSLLGGALGIGLAAAAISAIRSTSSFYLPRLDDAAVDGRILAFGLGLSLLVGLVFGVMPALRAARRDPSEAMRGSLGAGGNGGASRTRRLLVVAEVALTLMLLVGAGLLARSFSQLANVDPGFAAGGLATANVFLPDGRYPEDAQTTVFFQEVLAELESRPAVQRAAAITQLPMNPIGIEFTLPMEHAGWEPTESGAPRRAYYRVVAGPYFETMQTPLLQGRVLTTADGADGRRVMLINETLAANYFPDGDAVGAEISIPIGGPHQVVGVVADVRQAGLRAEPAPEMFIPFAQNPFGGMVIVARASGDAAAAASAIKEAVYAVDPAQPIYTVGTMQEHVSETVSLPRLNMMLMTAFAVVATLLAAVGIYGVLAFAVAQRRREIGVRLALGALPNDTMALIVRSGLAMVGVGIGIGLLGALALGRTITGLLYDVTPFDPWVLGGVTLGFVAVGVAASAWPALRATRIDPAVALRSE